MLGAGEPIKAISGDGLREPHGLAFDAHGTLYGTESVRTNRIFKLQGGRIEFISGVRWDSSPKGQEPPAPAKPLDLAPALYHGPADIGVANDGSLYVVDTFQHRILRLDPATHATTAFAGTGQAGFAGDGVIQTILIIIKYTYYFCYCKKKVRISSDFLGLVLV
jgi:sugar lactone lactonase YvrE